MSPGHHRATGPARTRESPESAAADLLEGYGRGVSLPVPLVPLARRAGWTVWTADLEHDVLGFVVTDPGGSEATLSRDSPPVRVRWVLARLIGRATYRRTLTSSERSGFVESRSEEPDDAGEGEYASRFAVALLLPPPAAEALLDRGASDAAIARAAEVPLHVAAWVRRREESRVGGGPTRGEPRRRGRRAR